MLSRTDLVVGAVAFVAILGVAAYARKKVAEVVASLPAGSFNPASTENVVYRGVNAAGAAATGDPGFSLGAAVYESGIVPAVNPASTENVVYRAVNAAGAAVTGDRAYSIGADIYENGIFRSPNPVAFVLDSLYALSPVQATARLFGVGAGK